MRLKLLFFVLFFFISPVFAEQKINLKVKIVNIIGNDGKILCKLYDNENGFPDADEKSAQNYIVSNLASQDIFCEFNGLSPDHFYAISVLHDKNGNNKMDTNIFGMPLEAWGVSNNAEPYLFGPPSFQDAHFVLKKKPTEIVISLRQP